MDYKRKKFVMKPRTREVLTKQEPAASQDINTIVERHRVTGVYTTGHVSERVAMYGDFTGIHNMSYDDQLMAIQDAHEVFMRIPAQIRARFDNSPQKLIDWVTNPENKAEAQKIGLLPKPERFIAKKVGEPLSKPPEKQPETAQEPPKKAEGAQ